MGQEMMNWGDETHVSQTALVWGVACELRERIDSARAFKWPLKKMTRKERKDLERAMGHLEEAAEYVCKLQGSVAERARLEGIDQPDRVTARTVNN